jgi:UMF1 family MFS transporter
MMAKLSPPEHASPLFGLFSLSAAATAWIAPVLVGAGTALFASQQAGLVPLLGMIALGCGFLCLVNLPQPAAGSMVVDNP